MKSQQENNPGGNTVEAKVKKSEMPCQPACPVCGGSLIDIRAKLQCSKCHRICETCCEGGRG
jgi:hypothetical protein